MYCVDMTKSISPVVGAQVLRYRKALRLSAEELAHQSGHGLTRSVIANLENGRKDDITVTQLLALASALHVPPALLIADIFKPAETAPYPMPGGDSNMASLTDWISATDFFVPEFPIENPATRLAYGAWLSVRQYRDALTAMKRAAGRYAVAKAGEQPGATHPTGTSTRERELAESARVVQFAIHRMRLSDVAVPDSWEEAVHELLSQHGIRIEVSEFSMYDPASSIG